MRVHLTHLDAVWFLHCEHLAVLLGSSYSHHFECVFIDCFRRFEERYDFNLRLQIFRSDLIWIFGVQQKAWSHLLGDSLLLLSLGFGILISDEFRWFAKTTDKNINMPVCFRTRNNNKITQNLNSHHRRRQGIREFDFSQYIFFHKIKPHTR